MQALIAAKADVNAADEKGCTALLAASQIETGNNAQVVSALVTANANVNAASARGETALVYAGLVANAAVARILLAAKASAEPLSRYPEGRFTCVVVCVCSHHCSGTFPPAITQLLATEPAPAAAEHHAEPAAPTPTPAPATPTTSEADAKSAPPAEALPSGACFTCGLDLTSMC